MTVYFKYFYTNKVCTWFINFQEKEDKVETSVMENIYKMEKDEGHAIDEEEEQVVGKEEGHTFGKEEGHAIGKEEGHAVGKEECEGICWLLISFFN